MQFMLADMAMKVEAARQLTYHAAIMSERAICGEKVPSLTFASSAAKCFASDAAMDISTDAVQLHGYHVAIFGVPGDDARAWRFEGQHLSVNVTVADGQPLVAPLFMGANPRPGPPR